MSLKSGMAALSLEMTDTVPRTEYSAESHWPLIKRVTGIDTEDPAMRQDGTRRFMKAWDYAFVWTTHVNSRFFERAGGRYTKMGHAEYAEKITGNSDYANDLQMPFNNPEEVYAFDPREEYGMYDRSELIMEIEREYRKKCEMYPDSVNMGGVYVTLFSGLIDMFGWDMLLTSMGMDHKRFGFVIDRYFQWVLQFYEAYAESDIPVFMSHDDLCWTTGPVTHPDWYREYIFPYLKRLLEPLRQAGKKIMFTCDGNWTEFFDDVVACGVNTVVMEPSSDMALFAEKFGKTHGFVGNADTRILLYGSPDDIEGEVRRCMDIGKECPGFILSVGNHIPQNTPVDNCMIYDEAYRKLGKR